MGDRDSGGISVRHIRFFLALVREGSVSVAADVLRIAQPSLSQQLARLERRVGVRLFERTPNGVALTPGGRRFLDVVKSVPAIVESAVASARSMSRPMRIAVGSGISVSHVASIERALATAIRDGVGSDSGGTQLSSASSDEQLALLSHAEIDFGLIRLPAKLDGFVAAVIATEELGVLLGEQHPLAALSSVSWEDLRGQRLMWFDEDRAAGFAEMVMTKLKHAPWDPELVPSPGRHLLFRHALSSSNDLVALRPKSAASAELVLAWRPLSGRHVPHESLALVALAQGSPAEAVRKAAEEQGWELLQ